MKSTSTFPVNIEHMTAKGVERGYTKTGLHPIEMIDLKDYKKKIQSVISYRIPSPFVKQILNTRITQNRIIPQD